MSSTATIKLGSSVTVSISESDTSSPFGSFPVAVAVFVTIPAIRSSAVIVYVSVNTDTSPGAIVVIIVVTNPVNGSLTSIPLKETLPVFSTVIAYVITSPITAYVLGLAVLVTVSLPSTSKVVSVGSSLSISVPDVSVTVPPLGSSALTRAVLITLPASTSSWVMV